MTALQKETYDYIKKKCSSHFMPNKKLWTAHITLGYDYQKYGNSQEEAVDTLASTLCIRSNIREFVLTLI